MLDNITATTASEQVCTTNKFIMRFPPPQQFVFRVSQGVYDIPTVEVTVTDLEPTKTNSSSAIIAAGGTLEGEFDAGDLGVDSESSAVPVKAAEVVTLLRRFVSLSPFEHLGVCMLWHVCVSVLLCVREMFEKNLSCPFSRPGR